MKVSVLGCGRIGRGIYEMLKDVQGFEPGPVLEMKGRATEDFMVDDIDLIVEDPTIDAVVESIGGIEPAFTYAVKAITSGKHFISTNKALIAEKGIELSELAKKNGVALIFSGACGGGMPYLHNLSLAAETDDVFEIEGIFNGTTNYILDAIQRKGVSFEEALGEAQELGYAERDPSADLSGLDTQRKIVLGCTVAFGKLPVGGICREGIENFTLADAEYLKSKGYACRLLGKAGRSDKGIYTYIEPALVGADSSFAAIHRNFNLAGYNGRRCGLMQFIGQGAGRWPTATAAIRDLCAVRTGVLGMMQENCTEAEAVNDIERKYFVRLPAEFAELFDTESIETCGETARLFTKPVSVESMHTTVKSIREKGAEVFFASVEEEND